MLRHSTRRRRDDRQLHGEDRIAAVGSRDGVGVYTGKAVRPVAHGQGVFIAYSNLYPADFGAPKAEANLYDAVAARSGGEADIVGAWGRESPVSDAV